MPKKINSSRAKPVGELQKGDQDWATASHLQIRLFKNRNQIKKSENRKQAKEITISENGNEKGFQDWLPASHQQIAQLPCLSSIHGH